MTDAMVDTNVLIRACCQITDKTTKDIRLMIESAVHLLEQQDAIRISAITWVEFQRGLKPAEVPRLAAFRPRFKIEIMDGPIAEKAADILRKRNSAETPCPRCLNTTLSEPCKKCGALIARQQKLNDAIIAATAEILPDVNKLYSFDGPMATIGPYLTQCRIITPPPPPTEAQMFLIP